MTALAVAAAELASAGAVPVCLDTCILLDLLRAPFRAKPHQLRFVTRLLNGAGDATPCRFVLASPIAQELPNNRANVTRELTDHLERLDQQIQIVLQCCEFASIGPVPTTEPLADLLLPAAINGLIDRIIAGATALEVEPECVKRAHQRWSARRRPAQSPAQFGDSLICEEYLELTRLLRAGGCAGSVLFVSSNTDDYCIQGSQLHPDLAAEFGPLALGFGKEWRAVADALGVTWS